MTLYKDINHIMPYFDKCIHVYGWNMSILWSPSKFWMPQNFTIANFRHPVSKSWLLHTQVAQLVRCQTVTSNHRVAGSIPGRGTLVCLSHLKNKMHKSAEIWERAVNHKNVMPDLVMHLNFYFSSGAAHPHMFTARFVLQQGFLLLVRMRAY